MSGSVEHSKGVVEWVLRREDREGGFGPWPDSKADFDSTCKAVEILSLFEALDWCSMDRVVSFISSFQSAKGGFLNIAKKETLLATKNALVALERISGTGEIDRDTCKDWLVSELRDKYLGPEEMFLAVEALKKIGELGSDTRKFVERTWWTPQSKVVKSLKHDANISQGYHYLKICESLVDSNGDELRKDFSDLLESFTIALERILAGEIDSIKESRASVVTTSKKSL